MDVVSDGLDTSDEKLMRRAQEDVLARDIIEETRIQLMLKFRFLDLALWRMELDPIRAGSRFPLATDTQRVAYDSPRVIARFQESFEESVRDYLHLIMHCIFRHPFDEGHKDRQAWELTCDIIVENAALDMCASRFVCPDDPARLEVIDQIKMLVGDILPHKVYDLIRNIEQTPYGQHYRGISHNALSEWRGLFERDEHSAWPAFNKPEQDDDSNNSLDDSGDEAQSENDSTDEDESETSLRQDNTSGEDQSENDGNDQDESSGDSQTDESENNNQNGENDNQDQSASGDSQNSDENNSDDDSTTDDIQDNKSDIDATNNFAPGESDADDTTQEEKDWEEIAKQIEMNLETFSKKWGTEAGNFVSSLTLANRKKYNYAEFLRKFMVVTEEMQLNMDEFDYIYYTYGLDLYGNLPLIEALEYKETERIHDFVIAIDTSESVSGKLVRGFVNYTFDILKSSENYSSEVNIHVVQCDARVQSDTKITNLSDVDEMMKDFHVRGFGGTDFRPVFDYVKGLKKRGEFTKLKGLIYFTDGLGPFPESPPDFDAAFVFLDDGVKMIQPVPPWAMKVVIDEEGMDQIVNR